MSSLQATAQSILAAVSSTSNCTAETVTTLSDLLSPKPNAPNPNNPVTLKKSAKSAATVSSKPTKKKPTVKPRGKKLDQENIHEEAEDCLSTQERSILATEVINVTLKALTDAIKNPPSVRRKASSNDLVKTSVRKALKRTNSTLQRTISTPQHRVTPGTDMPLQPRHLNRVASTPIKSERARSSSLASVNSSGNRSTAECAQAAFQFLRSLGVSKATGIDLPPLQLENGMSVLIGKLITLGLDDLAAKELRALKRRLEPPETTVKKGILKGAASATAAQTLAEILDFGKGPWNGSKLSLVITTQLQILRVMISSPRFRNADCALKILQPSHPSSPTKLLLLAAQDMKLDKVVRQLQNLSEILLSLPPSVSPSDDALALDSSLSVTPQIAIQLQSLALHNRVLWWKYATHKGDETKDLFDPLLRCLSAFARRSKYDALETYHLATTIYQDLSMVSWEGSDATPQRPKRLVSSFFRLFGSLAVNANLIDQAIIWAKKVQEHVDPSVDSEAKQCSIKARLVGLNLRKSSGDSRDEDLLLALLDSLESFKGDRSEVEDLLGEVSSVRRAAISILANRSTAGDKLTDGMREKCECLVFKCPQLCSRYLGKLPDSTASAKDIVCFEQRRQFVRKSGMHAIDSALFLIKSCLGEGRLTWDVMDCKLQDCLELLEKLGSNDQEISILDGTSPPSYYARISNLYFSQHLNMRRDVDGSKGSQLVAALKRSIDCVKSRPFHEKKSAYLSTKLERMAELYKTSGRYDKLFETLKDLRDECINNGTLSVVAQAAAKLSIPSAWRQTDETNLLARTLQSLIKVQFKCLNPESQAELYDGPWQDEEKGVLLELLLDTLSSRSHKPTSFLALQAKIFQSALHLYSREIYPVRRLRVLVRLLSLDIANQQEVTDSLSEELKLSQRGSHIEGTKDEGMGDYLAHFKNLLVTLVELQNEHPNVDIINNCLAVWSSIRKGCADLGALEGHIDDLPRLLAHLQLMADYMQMKGLNPTRLAVLRLIVDFNELRAASSNPNDLVLSFTSLGTQWLQLGYSGKAGLALDKAEIYGHENGVTPATLLQLHLSYAEYLLAIGNCNKSEEHLLRAQVLYSEVKNYASKSGMPLTLTQRTLNNQIISRAYLLHSMLALERGIPRIALLHAKISVRLLRRAWTHAEQYCCQENRITPLPQAEVDRLAEDVSQLNMSKIEISTDAMKSQPTCGSSFWALITPLFQGLFHLSALYAHHGMFQETLYYAQQAHQLVSQAGSEIHMAMASASLGNLCVRAGVLDKGSEYLMKAKQLCASGVKSREAAMLAYHLGSINSLLGDQDAADSAYDDADSILQNLATSDFITGLDSLTDPADKFEVGISKLKVSKPKAAATRKTAARSKTPAKRKAEPPSKTPIEAPAVSGECPLLMSLRGAVLREKARSLMLSKNCVDALNILQEAGEHSITQLDGVDQGLARAKQLLLQSMEQMGNDPVYSVLQESTISFPSIAKQFKADKSTGDRLSVARLTPPRKDQASKGPRSKSPTPNSFFDRLRQAQDTLIEVHSIALLVAPVRLIHTISALMNSVAILLSAAGGQVAKPLAHPGFASCSIESVRTLALRRERKATLVDPQAKLKTDESCWPSIAFPDARRVSLGVPHDMSRFQKDYLDIIPEAWTAISISLSDSRNELSITKLQSGQGPFVLRLPLGRHNSMDADEEVFGFEQGQSELLEIIQLANESAHDARNMQEREARDAWWEEREALDVRLRDLLGNIEKVWLGGFTGVFSQQTRRPDLLARFQKSFHNILDKHLPSRKKIGKRAGGPRITLDPRILELFIGLGDASAEDCDFSEPLTDLLYFVVDVLQFHGEFNAYAEIDFDTIVIETQDALRAYHGAARSSSRDEEGRHTILILDKALHAFPWESLPCMEGLAVSRLPSLGCLRDRILAQSEGMVDGAPHGHYIDRDSGSYVLNPSGDLKSTHATFQKPLQNLNGWNGITKREPTEEEMKSSLESNELFLYFGHGSGAQYIRAREIRKVEKCAVTILMGCSSGLLTEAGEYESYGTPINYMQAGSPALVAILWDVTDKDIDRFAKSTLEHWGLFESQLQTGGKGKGKKKSIESVPEDRMSLVEAVAKGREACHLRYLTAAAVCVYGVPVYFK